MVTFVWTLGQQRYLYVLYCWSNKKKTKTSTTKQVVITSAFGAPCIAWYFRVSHYWKYAKVWKSFNVSSYYETLTPILLFCRFPIRCLSVCLSVYLSLFISVIVSLGLFICLSVYVSVAFSAYLPDCLSPPPFISVPAHTHTLKIFACHIKAFWQCSVWRTVGSVLNSKSENVNLLLFPFARKWMPLRAFKWPFPSL